MSFIIIVHKKVYTCLWMTDQSFTFGGWFFCIFFYMLKAPNLPLVLNVLIDHPSNAHSHDSIVPRGDKHQSQTHAHAQEGQGPVGATGPRLDLCTYEYEQTT